MERETGRMFLIPVEKRDADTLVPILEQYIKPGTTIITDCWKAYGKLDRAKFRLFTVNHSITYVDENTGAHTNTIESTWRHVKTRLPAYARRSEFFGGYLARYIFQKRCIYAGLDPTVEFFMAAGQWYKGEVLIEPTDD